MWHLFALLLSVAAQPGEIPFFSRSRDGSFGVARPFDPAYNARIEVDLVYFMALTFQQTEAEQAHLEYVDGWEAAREPLVQSSSNSSNV